MCRDGLSPDTCPIYGIGMCIYLIPFLDPPTPVRLTSCGKKHEESSRKKRWLKDLALKFFPRITCRFGTI